MADYPGSLPSFTNPSPGDPANDASATDATVVVAKIHGELAAALAELGTNPSGSDATVKARLDALDSTVSGKVDSSSLAETIRDTMGTALVAGSNVTITVNDAGDTITIAASGGGGGLTEEEVEDIVNGLLVAGSNISLTYDDVANTLTVAVTGLGTAAALSTADIDERARDALGAALVAGSGITVTPNDGADTITVAATPLVPLVYSIGGALTTGAGAHRLYNHTGATRTITKIAASVGTAPASQAVILDVNKNGSTIWSTQANRVQVAASANVGTQTSFNTTTVDDGDYLTVDIDQVGTGTAGSDLTVTIWWS